MVNIFRLTIFLLFLSLSAWLTPAQAQTLRFAECDACGYCRGREIPSNWETCAKCVYPHVVVAPITNTSANLNSTLKIQTDPTKPNYNRPPQTLGGRIYTQLGCFGGNLLSLSDSNAGGELTNFILNNLIFPIVGTLSFGTIIWGGFTLATAQGDVYKIQQGKRLIASSLVGLIFTLSIVLIINTIGADILRIPGSGQGGDKITIKARALSCFDNSPERGMTPCPNVEAQIKDGAKIITRYNLGELSLSEKEYVFWTGISFNENSHKLHIYFKDDDYIEGGDKNVKITSVTRSSNSTNKTCQNFQYGNSNVGASINMNWGGTIENPYANPAICTQWSQVTPSP